MALVAAHLTHSMLMPSPLDSFLQGLLGDGRISPTEYSTAISLLRQEDERHRQTSIPGPVTLSYSALSTNQLATVSAVLNTVELIEHIFSYLDYGDLLGGVSRTCHGFRNIVQAAPALRRKLYLQAERAAELQTPPIRNIHYKTTYQYVEVLITNAKEVLSSRGMLGQMFLSQPPPTSLQMFYDCACRSRDAGTLVDEAGIKFSHVMDRLNEHFQASTAIQTGYKPCCCESYKEARLIFKSPSP